MCRAAGFPTFRVYCQISRAPSQHSFSVCAVRARPAGPELKGFNRRGGPKSFRETLLSRHSSASWLGLARWTSRHRLLSRPRSATAQGPSFQTCSDRFALPCRRHFTQPLKCARALAAPGHWAAPPKLTAMSVLSVCRSFLPENTDYSGAALGSALRLDRFQPQSGMLPTPEHVLRHAAVPASRRRAGTRCGLVPTCSLALHRRGRRLAPLAPQPWGSLVAVPPSGLPSSLVRLLARMTLSSLAASCRRRPPLRPPAGR